MVKIDLNQESKDHMFLQVVPVESSEQKNQCSLPVSPGIGTDFRLWPVPPFHDSQIYGFLMLALRQKAECRPAKSPITADDP